MTDLNPLLAAQRLAELLDSVTRPARYIGTEFNRVCKTSDPELTRVVLCFPDVYEIGMSHLGLKILYHILNERRDVWCQRAYAPWPDMEAQLRRHQIPLFSLEEHRTLSSFDIIGFSLQYELCFTNVLQMLDLGGVPLRQADRSGGPLVIAGGPCCGNPEPLAEFFDAFVVGEAEELLPELIDCYRRFQLSSESPAGRIRPEEKRALLRELSRIPGVYVPCLYTLEQAKGTVAGMRPVNPDVPACIQRRVVADLNTVAVASRPPVSLVEAVHDRITVEIMRGCPNQCFFCQAGFTGNPVRIKNWERVRDEIRQIYRATGYEAVSFCALSSAQYPHLETLVRDAYAFCKENGIAITLPSLRIDERFAATLGALSDLKKTSLTFAPEAGSERLRRVINKNLDISQLGAVIQQAYRLGWQRLKLYFMIGLPTETDEDLRAIAELVDYFSRLRTAVDGRKGMITVSIGNFIPKPHTPFQWQGMATVEDLRAKQEYLRQLFRRRSVRVSFHDARMSYVEAYLSRADRSAATVVQRAYERGSRFDGWSNSFNFSAWQEAMGLEPERVYEHVHAKRPADSWLPWQHINCGFDPAVLREWASRVTPDHGQDTAAKHPPGG